MDWWGRNAAEVQGISTIVLVCVTAYYAWQSRSTVKEMKKATDAQATEWDRQRRDAELERRQANHRRRTDLLDSATSEARANVDLLPKVHTHHAWIPLPIDALERLSAVFVEPLPDAVVEFRTHIRRYNTAAQYSNEKVAFGNGAMDNFLQELADDLAVRLPAVITELERLRTHDGG